MGKQQTRIFVNGFGRIGRTILRILLERADYADFEIVGINEIESLETCAYLFEYDSVFGPFEGDVSFGDKVLEVNGKPISFSQTPDLSELDLSAVDVVLECTGMAGSRALAESGLRAGAARVLISGPSDDADEIVVLGANEAMLQDQKIISNASCTTNALAPLMNVLDQAFGLVSGQMTTVHCYTGSQPTVDKPRANPERSRAAALSMVPTTTSAHRLIDRVLPTLRGRVEARAIRVPTASVSAIDLTIQTRQSVTVEMVNQVLMDSAAKDGIIGWTDKPLVSMDLRKRPESLVVCPRETSVSTGGLLRVFGWYDNEWGFSCRMLDMARLMARAN